MDEVVQRFGGGHDPFVAACDRGVHQDLALLCALRSQGIGGAGQGGYQDSEREMGAKHQEEMPELAKTAKWVTRLGAVGAHLYFLICFLMQCFNQC